MTNSDKFINWLEGYLDASKNKLTSSQIREIRKRIKDYHSIYSAYGNEWRNDSPFINGYENNLTPLNEEYLNEIEKHKSASTMEELEPSR